MDFTILMLLIKIRNQAINGIISMTRFQEKLLKNKLKSKMLIFASILEMILSKSNLHNLYYLMKLNLIIN